MGRQIVTVGRSVVTVNLDFLHECLCSEKLRGWPTYLTVDCGLNLSVNLRDHCSRACVIAVKLGYLLQAYNDYFIPKTYIIIESHYCVHEEREKTIMSSLSLITLTTTVEGQ